MEKKKERYFEIKSIKIYIWWGGEEGEGKSLVGLGFFFVGQGF